MISEKMIKLTESNSAIRIMFEEGAKMAEIHGRENVYDFSIGNPNLPPPESVKQTISAIVAEESPTKLHGYMNSAGFPETRRAVADSLNTRFGTAFTENNIIMSVGAAGGLNVVFKTLINPGDEIIAISPYFVDYDNYVNNYDGKIITVPANHDDFQPDIDAICAAITPKTKAIIINSPNNPTGVIYSEKTIRQIAEVLETKSQEFGAPIYIVSDEPYRELAYDGAEVPFITKFYRNTLVCYSWSKSLSLPGERIGYIVVPDEIDDYDLFFDAACIATRVLGFINAPSLMQKVVERSLDEQVNIAVYDENRKLLYNGLKECGFESVFPQGAFYMWLKTPGDENSFVNAAKKYNILIVPGGAFACSGYVRIAYCVAKETIEKSMPAFKKLAVEYGLLKE